jgi:hypothetical protein
MAKRRNPTPKTVTALVEITPPTTSVQMQVQAEPAASTDEHASVESVSVAPARAEVPTPGRPDESAPEFPETPPTIAARELRTDEPASGIESAVGIESRSPHEAISEHAVEAEVTAASATVNAAAAPTETMPAVEAAGEAVKAESAEPSTESVVVVALASAEHEAAIPGPTTETPQPVLEAVADLRLAHGLERIVPISRNREFLARAATVALAAGLGAIVGSLTTSTILPGNRSAKADVAQPDVSHATSASVDKLAADVATLKAALAANAFVTPAAPASAAAGHVDALGRDIAVLKASFGESQAGADTRLLELVAQVNRTEKAEADLAARLARIEKPDMTKADVSPEITGSLQSASPPIADGWVLWRVYNGRAVVQSRRGYFDVVPGVALPDLGLVREITQRDGRWVVITQNGTIVPAPGQRLG